MLIHPQGAVGIVDVLSLGEASFTTAPDKGRPLKAILEDPNIPKCFWDVRNDADALWAHYKVGLAGITDIQVLENASRTRDKTYLRGLDKCVQSDLNLGFMELNRWLRTKREIRQLMSADIFSARPIEARTVQYCTNDVIHLPGLRSLYLGRLKGDWLAKAKEKSMRRVEEAHMPEYDPHSTFKSLGPWSPLGATTGRRAFSLEDVLDEFEDQMMDARERDMFGGDDDVGYYDDWDDYPTNSRDAAWDDTFESCWCKSG